jgi:hypothetical protein
MLANSPKKEIDEGVFVLSSGSLSIMLVSSCDCAL